MSKCKEILILKDELPHVGWFYWACKEQARCFSKDRIRVSRGRLSDSSPGFSERQAQYALSRLVKLNLIETRSVNGKFTELTILSLKGQVQGQVCGQVILRKNQPVLKSRVQVEEQVRGHGLSLGVRGSSGSIEAVTLSGLESDLQKEREGGVAPPSAPPLASPKKPKPKTKPPKPAAQLPAFLAVFNAACPGLRQAIAPTPERERLFNLAWQGERSDIAYWTPVFERANKSDWATGKVPGYDGTYAKRNVEFVLRHYVNILEGQYDNARRYTPTVLTVHKYVEQVPDDSELPDAEFLAAARGGAG